MTRTLRYHTNVVLSSGAGTVGTYVFRANDCYDPDYTSTGHQPMGFDQLMAFYDHFVVSKSKITVQFKNLGGATLDVGIRLDANFNPISVASDILEFGGLTRDVLEMKNVYGSTKALALSMDAMRYWRIRKGDLSSKDSLCGDASNSPADCAYFHCYAWDTSNGSVNVALDVMIEIEATFFEPRTAAPSVARDEVKSGKEESRAVQQRNRNVDTLTQAAYRAVGELDVRFLRK